jgi:hypothetical protein
MEYSYASAMMMMMMMNPIRFDTGPFFLFGFDEGEKGGWVPDVRLALSVGWQRTS